MLAVAAEMLDGEMAYRKGECDDAFAHLRRAVELDDGLPYDEPWGWMQPTRHALGALLLEQGRVRGGRGGLPRRPGAGRHAPRGPASTPRTSGACTATTSACAARQAGEAAEVKSQLDAALAEATVRIEASCFCRGSAAA